LYHLNAKRLQSALILELSGLLGRTDWLASAAVAATPAENAPPADWPAALPSRSAVLVLD